MEKLGVHRDASELISVRNFLDSWDVTAVPGIERNSEGDEDDMLGTLSLEMERSIETIRELSVVCGESTLQCPEYRIKQSDLLDDIPPGIDLMTVRAQKEELQKRKQNPTYRSFIRRVMRMKTCDYSMDFSSDAVSGNKDCPKEFLVQHPDVILTVHVHKPNNTQQGFNMKYGLEQSLLVLGSAKLTDLRDKIACVNDLALAGDLSEDPDVVPANYAKDLYKSGFFYMEGCFYNDFRDSAALDYSQVIRDWATDGDRGIGPMTTASMADVSFLDLNIRLGQPYIYFHQGDCEHLIVFSDLRILSHQDSQDVRDYPLVTHKCMKNQTKCLVCQMHASRWMTYNSEHSPENPSFFCEQCFRSLHYDELGNKLGNFQAFRFFDSSAVI
ncbi:snRNA-activating protein complex subunit 3-like [Crassostrea virginica]|uniref:snRNA-activating protein complex subunit 3 n=1 Tax=Crassostrea virginica TaxID=6565 RepID=A0A8B8E011_CRAVI|nr:snRNA-activating protein complex subunit 3-like [Crassostrea virginica]